MSKKYSTDNFEHQLLEKILMTADEIDQDADDFPLVDPPTGLKAKLYGISDINKATFLSWKKIAGIAASAIFVIAAMQLHQQQQQYQQTVKASQDLALAFYYLQQSNAYAGKKVAQTLNNNFKVATAAPVRSTFNSLHIQQNDN